MKQNQFGATKEELKERADGWQQMLQAGQGMLRTRIARTKLELLLDDELAQAAMAMLAQLDRCRRFPCATCENVVFRGATKKENIVGGIALVTAHNDDCQIGSVMVLCLECAWHSKVEHRVFQFMQKNIIGTALRKVEVHPEAGKA